MKGVAGVPPDYFNKNGQLWGMPTFRWNTLKKTGYRWWIERIRTNIELFDILRLDHFRAFADYWEVPASHKNARKGKWKTGPGSDFFTELKKALGNLPFIAEDLGDINDAVYKLRDDFQLPGMKVLQFAFGDSIPTSDYIPHNYSTNFVVYTGTHDNNTTRGWYRKDIKQKERLQINTYTGCQVDERNVSEVLGRIAYASTAKTVIIPLQDLLALDETARMNTPASIVNNWMWRFKPGELTQAIEKQLKEWVWLFHRQGLG
jgi:4-alpha-glucanotransferase